MGKQSTEYGIIPKFKIAFSYTGDTRERIIYPVCKELLKMGYSKDDIFLDVWHPEVFLNGPDLSLVLRKIYQEYSDFVVVLLTQNYSEKSWSANLEWHIIRSMISEGNRVCLLQDGIVFNSIIGLDYRRELVFNIQDKTPSQIAEFVCACYNIHASRSSTIGYTIKSNNEIVQVVYPQNKRTVTFGRYPHKADGKETIPIEWYILQTQNNNALLISRFILDARPFHMEPAAVTWDACSLRRWLNDSFLSSAFSIEERNLILEKHRHADLDGLDSTERDIELAEKVFVLNRQEAITFFHNDEDRRCFATEYALARGADCDSYVGSNNRNACRWLLCSPGRNEADTFSVDSNGFIDSIHPISVSIISGVRPALWVKL